MSAVFLCARVAGLCLSVARPHDGETRMPTVFPERTVELSDEGIAALYRFDGIRPAEIRSAELVVRAHLADRRGEKLAWSTTRVVLRDREGEGVVRTLYLRNDEEFTLRLSLPDDIGERDTLYVRIYGNGRHRISLSPDSVSLRIVGKNVFRALSQTLYLAPRVKPDDLKALRSVSDRARFRFQDIPSGVRGLKLYVLVAVTDAKGNQRPSARTRILLTRATGLPEEHKEFRFSAGEATTIRLEPEKYITPSGAFEIEIFGNGRDVIVVTPDSAMLEIRN